MRRLNQLPLAFRWQGQLFFSASPTPPCVVRFVGRAVLGRPLGRAPACHGVPRKCRAAPFGDDVSNGQSASDAPIGTGECVDRFEPFERFECHTGFELCTVLFPLCRHRSSPPLPLLWTQHSILITCPVFGVHYRLSSHPSTRYPPSPTPPRPLNAPPAQTPRCTPPEATGERHGGCANPGALHPRSPERPNAARTPEQSGGSQTPPHRRHTAPGTPASPDQTAALPGFPAHTGHRR